MADLKAAGKAPRTIEQYEYNIERNLKPGIGELRVQELTTGVADRYLRAVEDKRGAATARSR